MSKLSKEQQIDDFDLETVELTVHHRESTIVALPIPNETLTNLERIALDRGMSVEGLLKFYIGSALRQDLTQEFIKKHP